MPASGWDIGRVDLAVDRRVRQILRQERVAALMAACTALGNVQLSSRLNCNVITDLPPNSRGHLFQARHLSELALQWRRDG